MIAIRTLFATLHKIDRENDLIETSEVESSDAQTFVNLLIKDISENSNKRGFKFPRQTSETSTLIREIYNQRDNESLETLFKTNSRILANKLLASEKRFVEKYPGMKKPRKGSLITTYNIDDNQSYSLIIAKIETEEFLSDVNLTMSSGLPKEKPALKTATITFVELEDQELSLDLDLVITDSSSTISKYWSENFLESEEITSNTKNTRTAFNEIEKVLSKNLKKSAPADYTELRNNLVGYFKREPQFQFDHMIQNVLGNYQMENDTITTDQVKEKLISLRDKQKFDTQFDLIPNEIKARFKKTYKVTDEIELRTNGHVDDLKHVIHATTNTEGERILEIKITDEEVFKQFNFKEDN